MFKFRPYFFFAALFIFLIALAACGGDEVVPFAQEEQAVVSCSEECAAHGQCGVMGDGRQAVLANEVGPAVSNHDRFFVHGTLVTVVELSPRELIAARGGVPMIGQATPFPHQFYRVSGDGKTAWVSAWCLARP